MVACTVLLVCLGHRDSPQSTHPFKMATFEQIINSSTLDIVVPNVFVEFPVKDTDHGAWLQKLTSQEVERQRAFFGTFASYLLSSTHTLG